MTLKLLAWFKQNGDKTLAQFGKARLVKTLTGKIELAGDSADDQTAAKEWASLFLHETAI